MFSLNDVTNWFITKTKDGDMETFLENFSEADENTIYNAAYSAMVLQKAYYGQESKYHEEISKFKKLLSIEKYNLLEELVDKEYYDDRFKQLKDSNGEPRWRYLERIRRFSLKALIKETSSMIWLSENTNGQNDFGWRRKAVWYEWWRRNGSDSEFIKIYNET